MHKLRRRLAVVSCGGALAVVLSGVALAQSSQTAAGSTMRHDVFAPWNESLSDAADRTLAAALADKPWMKTPRTFDVGSSQALSSGGDPVVRLRSAIARVEQLRPTVEPILREQGVPAELSAVMLVESGGQATALSAKGARGVWQFMPDTARRYGLAVSSTRDERLDITKSTRAAARYLRDLYQQFGDWQLAFAAYNAGEHAIGQAIARVGERNFSAIQRVLPPETRNYVPAVLAAIGHLQDHGLHDRGQVIYVSMEAGN